MSRRYSFEELPGFASTEPYLKSRGWELLRQGELGNRWRLVVGDAVRNVAVPHPDLDEEDQRAMYSSLLRTLADVERRDAHLINRDMVAAASDLVEFRLIADELQNGEMPLRAAPELTSGAFEALQSAARAEVARRAHYRQGTLPAQVKTFVEGATLAGTEAGSVILQVRTPAQTTPAQETFEGLPALPSFERRAVMRLVKGLQAAKTAAHRDPAEMDLNVLDDDVEDGLSANLCQALVKLSGETSEIEAQVIVRVRWALSHPADEEATNIEVERGELARLPDIARILKRIEPIPNTTVQGPTTRFERGPGEDTGWVTLTTEVDGRVRPVRIQVDRSDYDLAWTAHSSERELRATGTLERAGRSSEIVEPQSLEIVEP